jgi:hypothetical protein
MAKAKRVHSTPRRTASKSKPRLSAVSRVKLSGFDLVPTRKRPGKRATIRDLSKIDFKPWKRERGMGKTELFPASGLVDKHAVTCRMAYALMLQSRSDLIAMHEKIAHEGIDELMGELAATEEFLKSAAHMVKSAYMRVLVSASVAVVQNRPFKGVNDKPDRKGVRS